MPVPVPVPVPEPEPERAHRSSDEQRAPLVLDGGRALRFLASRAAFVALLAVASGCATVPFFRPQGPPLDEKVAEAGIGPFVEVARDKMGVGSAFWMHAQIYPDVELVLKLHGADFFPYSPSGEGRGGVLDDVQAGAAAGIRGRYRALPDLLLGGEFTVDYFVRTATEEHFIAGIVGFPVAERAAEGLWVYTNPSIGVAIPLHDDPAIPFFGINEIPLGIAWEAADWLIVVVEGGYALPPINGGYGAVAVAFRL